MIDVGTYPTICDRTDGASRKSEAPVRQAARPDGHQPKYLIKREQQDILARSPSVANDNRLAWPLIPFPEDWYGA
jgi:hypothetical protein